MSILSCERGGSTSPLTKRMTLHNANMTTLKYRRRAPAAVKKLELFKIHDRILIKLNLHNLTAADNLLL